MKAGTWFIDGNGDHRMVFTSRPDCEGDYLHVAERPFDNSWDYTHAETLKERKLARREPWIALGAKVSPKRYQHTFRAFYSPCGRKSIITAGCMAWGSLADARKHYKTRDRHFLDDEANEAFNTWALRYLDRLEEAMRSRRAVKVLRKMVEQRRAA
jgi:hypothetical protein